MKILVLGATGMAGHVISIYLKEQKHDVVAFSRQEFPYCRNICGDISDIKNLRKLLQEEAFDAVINCVGILNKNCDSKIANAILINSYIPHLIAELLADSDTKFIPVSYTHLRRRRCAS